MIAPIDPNGLPGDVARLLFEAWLWRMAEPAFGLSQYGSGDGPEGHVVTMGSPNDRHFVLTLRGLDVTLTSASEVDETGVAEVIHGAASKVADGDFGAGVVYLVEMTLAPFDLLGGGLLHFMRTLGDQVHIEGSRRLSDAVILDFEAGLLDDAPPDGLLLAPPSKVQVTVFAPGPCPSDFSRNAAVAIADVVAALCAFATGRTVQHHAPPFPADEEATTAARARQRDPAILGLARDSISLDVFSELNAIGGTDAVLRVRGALLAYHAALQQVSPDVAVMLFVTSIEALISPRGAWGKRKVTTRFVKALIGLCPSAVDELLGHANVETAFGFVRRGGTNRQRRELLEIIYETRSIPTHTGLQPSAPPMALFGAPGSMRVALLSDLARASILAFIRAPRSSLVGHPGTDPPGGQ